MKSKSDSYGHTEILKSLSTERLFRSQHVASEDGPAGELSSHPLVRQRRTSFREFGCLVPVRVASIPTPFARL